MIAAAVEEMEWRRRKRERKRRRVAGMEGRPNFLGHASPFKAHTTPSSSSATWTNVGPQQ